MQRRSCGSPVLPQAARSAPLDQGASPVNELANRGLGSAVVDGHDAAVEVQVLRDERGQRIDGPVADGSGDITVQLNDLPGHLLVERVTLEALQTFLDEVPWEQLSGVTDS